jgi:hypothetical protein
MEAYHLDPKKETKPACVAVLNPGNYESPLDVMHQLFIEHKVVICKLHPSNDSSMEQHVLRVLDELIRDGFVGVVGGGVEISQAVLHHPKCDEAMMTGGCKTYDAIMWGKTTAEVKANKNQGKMLLSKPFFAELVSISFVLASFQFLFDIVY